MSGLRNKTANFATMLQSARDDGAAKANGRAVKAQPSLVQSCAPRSALSWASTACHEDQYDILAGTCAARQTDGNDRPGRATIPARILRQP